MSGRRGDAATRRSSAGRIETWLALPRQTSLLVATTSDAVGEPFAIDEPAGAAISIEEPWQLRFVSGGPGLPRERQLGPLGSWTDLDGDDVKAFSGTAVYSTTVARPATRAAAWELDLGRVHDSARVRINGRDLGTLIGPAFRVRVEDPVLAERTQLEVFVTNLMANRIAALDRQGVVWRRFSNINFPARLPVNRGSDGLFTAAHWEPLAAGLIGPVTLTPVRPRLR
jgi:hypothetical protein